MFMTEKYIKKYRGGYKGCSPPKTPKCINLQMPISLNEEMTLNKSWRPIFKMFLMIPAQLPTTDTYLYPFNCNVLEGNWRFLIFSIFPCGSKSKLALKNGRFFNGTQIDWMRRIRKKLLTRCS